MSQIQRTAHFGIFEIDYKRDTSTGLSSLSIATSSLGDITQASFLPILNQVVSSTVKEHVVEDVVVRSIQEVSRELTQDEISVMNGRKARRDIHVKNYVQLTSLLAEEGSHESLVRQLGFDGYARFIDAVSKFAHELNKFAQPEENVGIAPTLVPRERSKAISYPPGTGILARLERA